MGRYYDSWALTMSHGPTITHRPKKTYQASPIVGVRRDPLKEKLSIKKLTFSENEKNHRFLKCFVYNQNLTGKTLYVYISLSGVDFDGSKWKK